MKKPLCKCGHGRSAHKYIYYGKILSSRSPCKECNVYPRSIPVLDYITHERTGKNKIILAYTCMYYTPMDNLTLIEHLANKKGI